MRITTITLLAALLIVAQAPAQVDYVVKRQIEAISPILTFDIQAPDFKAVASSKASGGLRRVWIGYRKAMRSYRGAEKQKSQTKKARSYRFAAQGFDTALKRLQKLGKRYGNADQAVAAETGRLTPHFLQAARVSYLEVAIAYTSRGSYKRALDAVERTIQLNPRDRRARRLREHIQLAQAAAGRRS